MMRGRRRRPLMRAAMMGGAGYVAGKHAANRQTQEAGQEQRLDSLEQSQAPAPAPAPPAPVAAAPAAAAPAGGTDIVSKLNELKGLLDSGALTQEEFDAAKAQALQGN